MMTEAQRQLQEELNAHTSDLQARLDATRDVLKWLKQAIRQAQPEASKLHHNENVEQQLKDQVARIWAAARGRLRTSQRRRIVRRKDP
jgi:hypothetical protein